MNLLLMKISNNYNPISEVEVEFYRKAISEGHYDLEVFCNKFSIQKNPKNKHKVFLGGTCNRSKWRNELIELLEIDYFNPVVKNWNQDCQ